MADRKKTDRKCAEIIAFIVNKCNEDLTLSRRDQLISFGADWGGNTLTVFHKGKHTHVGNMSDGGTFEELIDQLHALLIKGEGLSWE